MSITIEEPPAEEVGGKIGRVYESLLEVSRMPNRWCKIDDPYYSTKTAANQAIKTLREKKDCPRVDADWSQFDIVVRMQAVDGDPDKRAAFIFARFIPKED